MTLQISLMKLEEFQRKKSKLNAAFSPSIENKLPDLISQVKEYSNSLYVKGILLEMVNKTKSS